MLGSRAVADVMGWGGGRGGREGCGGQMGMGGEGKTGPTKGARRGGWRRGRQMGLEGC
jgi:hypothetical protein